jgi:hypothetical protein
MCGVPNTNETRRGQKKFTICKPQLQEAVILSGSKNGCVGCESS